MPRTSADFLQRDHRSIYGAFGEPYTIRDVSSRKVSILEAKPRGTQRLRRHRGKLDVGVTVESIYYSSVAPGGLIHGEAVTHQREEAACSIVRANHATKPPSGLAARSVGCRDGWWRHSRRSRHGWRWG